MAILDNPRGREGGREGGTTSSVPAFCSVGDVQCAWSTKHLHLTLLQASQVDILSSDLIRLQGISLGQLNSDT